MKQKRERELQEIQGMFTQLMQNQGKVKRSEGSSRRRHCHEDSHSPSHHNADYYQPLPSQNRNRNPTFPKKPKINLLPFHG